MIKINFSQILNSIKNKKKIVVPILVVLLIFSIYQIFFKKNKNGLNLAEVGQGTITQEVSETGKIKKGDEIDLNFKNSGKIEKIYVKVGDNVTANQDLAKLDTSQLYIQLQEAEANLDITNAQKSDAQISLKDAQDNLESTIAAANKIIEENYKDALVTLDDAYLKTYNSLVFINYLRDTYFNRGDVQSINVLEDKVKIERAFDQIKSYTEIAKSSSKDEDIDVALSKTEDGLSDVKIGLEEARTEMETIVYKDIISSTNKSTLDTHKLNINTVYANIISAQQNISLAKINNKTNIDAAQSQVSSLENQLKESEAGLYQAQLTQAEAQMALLESQINDATLKSPIEGQIIKVNKREGELTQPTSQEPTFVIMPSVSFEVTVDIYEEDIVNVKVGNPVDIKLTAFPNQILSGKVILIDPAEKLIEGVVYYEVTIDLQNPPQDLKPGMTADITIKTAQKDNVLIIPGSAILEKDGKSFVQIIKKGNNLEERQIETGLKSNDNMVEVTSGLQEGEKIAIPK